MKQTPQQYMSVLYSNYGISVSSSQFTKQSEVQ